MTDYIFKAPPPPPPRASNFSTIGEGSNTRNIDNSRGSRGRGRSSSNIHEYANRDRGRGTGTGKGRGCNNFQNNIQQSSQRYQQDPGPNIHLNPTFFPELQTRHVQPSSAHVFVPVHSSRPNKHSYGDIPTAPVTASHAQYRAPMSQTKRQKISNSRADMSHDQWIALNGGKLIGTNIKPPESASEIALWIAERKKRFPTAAMRAKMSIEVANRQGDEDTAINNEIRKYKAPTSKYKQEKLSQGQEIRVHDKEKRDNCQDESLSASDSDQAPEELSTKSRIVFRDENHKNIPKRGICRTFRDTGSCSRGTKCHQYHKDPDLHKNNFRRGITHTKERKSLYSKASQVALCLVNISNER
ncbi:hypothetical protein EDC01DRAFT_131245 [Geopyxis carbonaria]|nr:hypothetical protein EDC01DRAFT_131245 [Geopyxis carbonaria]